MKFVTTILIVFLVGSKGSQAETTVASGSPASTMEESTIEPLEPTDAEDIDLQPVEYCSQSEIMTDVQEIDYSWTQTGALSYIAHLGYGNYENMNLMLNVSHLKFHEKKLPGNWSFSLSKEAMEPMQIKMLYATTDAEHLVINGEALIRLPCGSLIHPEFRFQKVDHPCQEHQFNGQYYHGNYSGNNHRASNETLFEIRWTVRDDLVLNLIRKLNEIQNGEHNSTSTFTDKLALHFHINAVKTLPPVTKLSTECNEETVQSLKKKEREQMWNNHRYWSSTGPSAWSRQYHSTGSPNGWSRH